MAVTKPWIWCSPVAVKGIGLVGAVVKLMEADYRARRVAGSSAGSIVGAIVAAAARDDRLTPDQVRELALSIDYRKFLDPGPVESVPLLGPAWAILQGSGIYRGDYAHRFIADQLRSLGVTTFADLRLDDDELPRSAATGWWSPPPTSRPVSWCGCRGTTGASTVWTPIGSRWPTRCGPRCRSVHLPAGHPDQYRGLASTLVDGGLLSNYPIDSLDRQDGKRPRWPTFGVTLLPNLPEGNDRVIPRWPHWGCSAARICSSR